jgi:superfamily II DNA or RNA helicase
VEKEHKIFITNRVYIPEGFVDPSDSERHYTRHFYEDVSCAKCEYKPERPSAACKGCSAYKGKVVAHNKKKFGGKRYVGLPIGDRKNIERKIGIDYSEFKIIDRRVTTPFDYKIKFKLTLRDYQVKLTETFMKRGAYGFMVAPPRSGKTPSMLSIAITKGLKTLVVASQHAFLQQYIWHIEGNEQQSIPRCTNLPFLQRKYGKKLYGFPKTDEDYENFQFFFMSYQSYISAKGQDRLKKIMPLIGMLQIDEAHQSNATEFATVVGSFPSRYKLAATGTPSRKDKKDWVMKQIVGPVISEIVIDMLVPTVVLHPTNITPKRNYSMWVYAMQFLAKHKKRNEMIVAQVIKDVANGHSVVIPVTFKNHVAVLVEMINKAAGEKIAEPYVGKGKGSTVQMQEDTLTRVKQGETKVIVGIRRMIQLGLNVAQWSALYVVIPISNEPNWKQESSRILTPLEGKNNPVIRMFYDEMGQSKGCARNTINHSLKFKHVLSEKSKKLWADLKQTKRKQTGDGSEEIDKVSSAKVSSLFSSKQIGRRL